METNDIQDAQALSSKLNKNRLDRASPNNRNVSSLLIYRAKVRKGAAAQWLPLILR